MKNLCIEDVNRVEELIPIGKDNAVSRKYLSTVSGLSDRMVRRCIEKSERKIVNLGYGYFVPDENDEEDAHELAIYIAQERARIESIRRKMEKYLD